MQGRNSSAAESSQNHSRAEKADAQKKQWRDPSQGVIRKHPPGRRQKGNQDQHSIGFKGLSIRFQATHTLPASPKICLKIREPKFLRQKIPHIDWTWGRQG